MQREKVICTAIGTMGTNIRPFSSDVGRIDMLGKKEGICKTSSVVEMKESEWDEKMDVNLEGKFYIGRKYYQK